MTMWFVAKLQNPPTGRLLRVFGDPWWAVEHAGHPAFYLRALMPGDFAPGRLPLARHVWPLAGAYAEDVACGTCGGVPRAEALEVVERHTGARGFLALLRAGRQPWPRATDASRCWLCGCRDSAWVVALTPLVDARMCERCRDHLKKE